jgi:hypothetical protein
MGGQNLSRNDAVARGLPSLESRAAPSRPVSLQRRGYGQPILSCRLDTQSLIAEGRPPPRQSGMGLPLSDSSTTTRHLPDTHPNLLGADPGRQSRMRLPVPVIFKVG